MYSKSFVLNDLVLGFIVLCTRKYFLCIGDRGVHASALYNKDTAGFRLWHDFSGAPITDVNVFLTLEQSRILKTQLNWRPKMWEELRVRMRFLFYNYEVYLFNRS